MSAEARNALGAAIRNAVTCEINLHSMDFHGAVRVGYSEEQMRELKKEMARDVEEAWSRVFRAIESFEKECKR
jgi:hypothetical protein